jgi:hypothetical protein
MKVKCVCSAPDTHLDKNNVKPNPDQYHFVLGMYFISH